MGKTYVCVLGSGNFVPGLPAEISDEEAKIFGLEKLLADALKDGAYAEKGSYPPAAKAKPPAKPPAEKEGDA